MVLWIYSFKNMATSLFTLKDCGNHTIFQPPKGYSQRPGAEEARLKRIADNQAWIDSHHPHPTMRITGSFIYAHAPNYVGEVTLEWTEAQWREQLERLQSYGIDTVIFQASLWNELHECYYPSKIFSDYRSYNVVEAMLNAARSLGLTIYLGGYGSVTCWKEKLDAGIVDAEVEKQSSCFKELLQLYKGKFDGFYFSPESAFLGTRNPELENYLSMLYGRLFSEIRAAAPELKILMSPATFYFSHEAFQEMIECWCEMFKNAHPDIIAPQDTVGCGLMTLNHQDEAFKAWSEICRRCNITLWSNVEIFECMAPDASERTRRGTTPERIRCQMATAEKYVQKLITWEALYYTSNAINADAIRTQIFEK